MSSVASTNPSAAANPGLANPGLADVLNIISNAASPALSSLLSSSNVQSALQNASPADLVQLSDQALQLQTVDSLFGNADTSQASGLFGAPSASDPATTLDNLVESLTQPASAATSSSQTTSIASQLAIYQGQLEAQNAQTLFGTSSGGTGNVNLLG